MNDQPSLPTQPQMPAELRQEVVQGAIPPLPVVRTKVQANKDNQPIDYPAQQYRFVDPALIPSRQRLLGDVYLRGIVSMTSAAGGTGKSSLLACEALALASGKPLLGETPKRRCRVWFVQLEDSLLDIQRAIAGIAKHYGLTAADLEGHLFVTSGMDQPMNLAGPTDSGFKLNDAFFDALAVEMIRRKIDVLILDPYVSAHDGDENSNPQMDKILKALSRLAKKVNASIHLVHHSRKPGFNEKMTAHSSRGASAIVNACRVVRVLESVSKTKLQRYGLEETDNVVQAKLDKINFAPKSGSQHYKIVSVELGNGEGQSEGDSVGVFTRWQTPATGKKIDEFISDDIIKACLAKLSERPYRSHPKATDWGGHVIAEVLGINTEKKSGKARVQAILSQWVKKGLLEVIDAKDKTRQDRPFFNVVRP